MFKISQKNFNDIHLGLCFTILFTAYNGQVHVQQVLTVSIHEESPNYNTEGFITLGIVYTFFTLSVWLAPYFIAVMGCRMTLALGSICYFPIVTFDYFENNWVTYASGAITGFGSGLLWTAQGTYSVLNSEVGRVHSTICKFLLFYQASQFIGNVFIYWLFDDPDKPINRTMRAEIAIFLGAFVLCSSVLLAILRPPVKAPDDEAKQPSFRNEIKKTLNAFPEKQMLLSIPMFIFYGLIVSFVTILPATLGFSKHLSINSKKFAPLSGMLDGCGQIMGICLSWFTGEKWFKFFLLPSVCLYCLVALGTIFLGLPDSSVFTYTDEKPNLELPLCILLIANVLLSMADSIVLVESYDIVANINPADSAPSFAMSQFIKNLACTMSYFYSNYFGLQVQVIILMFFAASTLLVHCWIFRLNIQKKIEITENATSKRENQQESYVTY